MEQRITLVENLDYKKYKLFLLSILWRASISSHPFFKDVSIPGEYNELLRTMLLKNNPGKFNDFPIMALSNVKNKNVSKDIIGQPIKGVKDEKITITFLLSQYFFIFNIMPDFKSVDEIIDITPMENGNYRILDIPYDSGRDLLFKFTNLKE